MHGVLSTKKPKSNEPIRRSEISPTGILTNALKIRLTPLRSTISMPAQKSTASKRDEDFHAAPNGRCGVGAHAPNRGLAACLSLGWFQPVAVSHPNN